MNDNEILENKDENTAPETALKQTGPLPEYDPEEVLTDAPVVDDTLEFDLEDILREFGSDKTEEKMPEQAPASEETAAEEAAPEEAASEETAAPVTADTIRLDTVHIHADADQVKDAKPVEEEITEVFNSVWEPEYEQPMGEYVPPQPIQFRPRSRIKELKRQLVAGPEKRYYELAEKGLGKLQISMLFSLLIMIICTGITVLHQAGVFPEERLKLLVFIQFFALLLSALLGCQRLIDGFLDIFKKRFTMDTMLVVTFLVCCADGVLGLMEKRIPCCAAFSLQMTMSLWSAYQRRYTEMGQMDALRKATRLDAVQVSSGYYDKHKGLLRRDGELNDFMDNYQKPTVPEKVICWYALIATVVSLGVGGAAYLLRGNISEAVNMAAVCLLAAAPATIFITNSRPMAILQKRLHDVGAVICGWQGVKMLRGKSVFPVEYTDLFPAGAARMNGVKFFGSRPTDEVVAYGTAVITANGSGLTPLFQQVLDSRNGYHYAATDLCCYNGGVGGTVRDEQVLVGSISFLKEMGVAIPKGMRVNQAVCVAIAGELAGLFALNYENARPAAVGLASLCSRRGAKPIFVNDDFLLNAEFIQSRFGVSQRRMRFVTPEERAELRAKQPDEGKPAALLVTKDGLASFGYAITGAKALRAATTVGTVIHLLCGVIGIAMMVTLLLIGRLDLLTPANLFAYQLVWLVPGLLITEWTRAI